MSGVVGRGKGIDSINRLKGAIRALPLNLRTAVAKDAAGYLDMRIRTDFAAGVTVYDTPRPLSVDARHPGRTLTLVKSGRTRRELGFVQIGTIIRAQLGQKYARFLVGKYKVLPISLPASWRAYLQELVADYAGIAKERGLLP